MDVSTIEMPHGGRAALPMTLAEIMAGIQGGSSKDKFVNCPSNKSAKKTAAVPQLPRTVPVPLTLAEMRAGLQALTRKPARKTMAATTAMKKKWNTSVKYDKKTATSKEVQLRKSGVRKVLNFQPKTVIQSNQIPRPSVKETTPKCNPVVKKSYKPLQQLNGKNNTRISGVCKFEQTPQPFKKPAVVIPKVYINNNKENIEKVSPLQDIPMSCSPCSVNSETSFLQKEKDILQDIGEQMIPNIADISAPVSTPFKDYRDVYEYFNDSSVVDVPCADNKIMDFDKTQLHKVKEIKEDSVIVALCDLMNKAKFVETSPQVDRAVIVKLKIALEKEILTLSKQHQLLADTIESMKSMLQEVNELERSRSKSHEPLPVKAQVLASKSLYVESSHNESVVTASHNITITATSPLKTVIRYSPKSPTYKIPRTNCLRRKSLHKSMPMDLNNVKIEPTERHIQYKDRARSMYLKMKEEWKFLNTPLMKRQMPSQVPDTPAVTSMNLQNQLDKLYNGTP